MRSSASNMWHMAYGSLLAGLLSGIYALAPAPLEAQGIRYHLRSAAVWTQWDDALGLENARFLGGSAGIGFGRYVDLTGFYLKSDDRATNLSSLPFSRSLRAPLADQYVDIASYGSELAVGLSRGSFVPVLMGGAGILRFRPEAGQEIQRLQLKYGLGFRTFVTDALEAEVMVERNRYYLDPLDLAAPVAVGDPAHPDDPGAGALRRNLALRVGLGVQLGGRDYYGASEWDRDWDRGSRRFSGAGLALEPFAGRQTFDASLEIEDQVVAGVRAGLDLGRFVGLRGFWWRGVDDGYDAWEGIEGYGGEAQFNLGGDEGFSPHLLAGAGRMEFAPDFAGSADLIPADRATLILGGGVDLGLGSHVRLSAAARDYIMSGPDFRDAAVDLGDVKDPRHLVHNWQMSAGLGILVGGGRRSWRGRARAPARRRAPVQAETRRAVAVDDARAREAPSGAVVPGRDLDVAPTEPAQPAPVESTPVPEITDEAEPPAAEVADQADPPAAGLSVAEPESVVAEQVSEPPRLDPSLEFPARELRPYTGILGGTNTQWVFGVAVNWGPSDTFTSFDIVPEASLSVGQGKRTWMIAANLQYRVPWVFERDTYWINPVTSFGPGLLNQDGSEVVLNASYGVNIQLRRGLGYRGDPVNIYIAHQGIDLFESDRLIVGLSLER